MTKASRLLVVDASVLRAAGRAGALHPVSAHCRDILIVIYEVCHRCTVTKDLRIEWKRNVSRFSELWKVQMTSRRKLPYAPEREGDTLLQRICAALPTERRPTVEKDFHLVEAAIAAERIIISCDDRARSAFAAASSHIPELGRICWINPGTDGATTVKWLRGEIQARREWNLDPARERV